MTGALSSGPLWENAKRIAAQYPDIPFPDGWKANIGGVDLNLQFPAGWEEAKRIKFAQGWTGPRPGITSAEPAMRAGEPRPLPAH